MSHKRSRRDTADTHLAGVIAGHGRPFVPRRNGTSAPHESRSARGIIIPHVVPGYTRDVGFYGRYNQSVPRGGGCGLASEKKFHDLDLDDAVIASTVGVTGSINVIAQGTTGATRVGRKICIRNISWRFEVSLPAVIPGTDYDDANFSDTVRVMMFLDTQCNGLIAPGSGFDGILQDDNFQSFNNLANKGRFRILFDRFYVLNRKGYVGFEDTTPLFKYSAAEVTISDTFYKKCEIPLEYDANVTTGALVSIRSNNLGVLLISRLGKAKFHSKIRLRFED